MSTNHFFKDLYFDRWGDPENPNAVEPCSTADKDRVAAHSILDRLRQLFRRCGKRPSAWSFTIPSETALGESRADVGHRNPCDATQPKFLAIAKALSRNC